MAATQLTSRHTPDGPQELNPAGQGLIMCDDQNSLGHPAIPSGTRLDSNSTSH